MSPLTPLDDFAAGQLIAYVDHIIHPAAPDANGGASAEPAREEPEDIMSMFLLLVRALSPRSRVDDAFMDLHIHLATAPEAADGERTQLRNFREDYAQMTRMARVQWTQDHFQQALQTYTRARHLVRDATEVHKQLLDDRSFAAWVEAEAALASSLRQAKAAAKIAVDATQECMQHLLWFNVVFR